MTMIQNTTNVRSLTIAFVNTTSLNVKWQLDSADMAQGFIASNRMPPRSGRDAEQRAVLVISECENSFKYQTAEESRELKDKYTDSYITSI